MVSRLTNLGGRLSDIAGFVFFAALSASLVLRVPELGFLLLPLVSKELFTAFAFLIRDPARASVGTFGARAAAYSGTFGMVVFFHAVRTWSPETLAATAPLEVSALGAIAWLAGTSLVVVSIWWLRFAFSIEPEARRIVRTGPYGLVRHPVYLAYVLQFCGIWLIHPSRLLAVAIAAWVAITLVRMHFEERVLVTAFPEYEEYRRTTRALLPIPVVVSAETVGPRVRA